VTLEGLHIEERVRTLIRDGRVYVPQCPWPGCKLKATFEIKDGHRFVGRWCRAHAEQVMGEMGG
jgi:hypothetical protein